MQSDNGAATAACVAGSVITGATITVPVNPGGITGTYNLVIDGSATFNNTVLLVNRTGTIGVVVDGVVIAASNRSATAGTGTWEAIATNARTSLSAASTHTVALLGCADVNTNAVVPASRATINVAATP
jgi:hypothetical protein